MDTPRRLQVRFVLPHRGGGDNSFAVGGHRGQASGFTLHETLIALTIVGILSMTAVGFTRMVQSTRAVSDVNTLVADLSLARSEAIKRGLAVTLCQSDSTTDCTGISDWHRGWIVFADTNNNRSVDDDDLLIRVQQPLSQGMQVRFRGSGVGRDHYVTYWPSGFATPNGTFTFCNSQGSRTARTIILYWTGRARASTKNAEGGPPDCL